MESFEISTRLPGKKNTNNYEQFSVGYVKLVNPPVKFYFAKSIFH